jgi:hypothetical protein
MTALPPLTPEALALSDAFADGAWRDEHGRPLTGALLAAFDAQGHPDPHTATVELFRAAALLFHTLHPQVIGDPDAATWTATAPAPSRTTGATR